MERDDLIYKITLKKLYGLSNDLIARLGEPDRKIPNPHYRNQPPACLYSRRRVEQFIENNRDDYDRAMARRARHQARATAVAQQRTAALLDWSRTVEVKITGQLPESLNDLEEAVILDRVAFELERYGHCGDGFMPGRGALLAYLRHQHTNYHRLLTEVEGKPGCDRAYQVIKERCTQLVEQVLQELEAI